MNLTELCVKEFSVHEEFFGREGMADKLKVGSSYRIPIIAAITIDIGGCYQPIISPIVALRYYCLKAHKIETCCYQPVRRFTNALSFRRTKQPDSPDRAVLCEIT